MLGQQVLGAEITDILNIANIADIVTDIANIVIDITDIVNIVDNADRVLQTLRWKQVGVYKVLWGYPITKIKSKYSLKGIKKRFSNLLLIIKLLIKLLPN